jgi:hypothetical protein
MFRLSVLILGEIELVLFPGRHSGQPLRAQPSASRSEQFLLPPATPLAVGRARGPSTDEPAPHS